MRIDKWNFQINWEWLQFSNKAFPIHSLREKALKNNAKIENLLNENHIGSEKAVECFYGDDLRESSLSRRWTGAWELNKIQHSTNI